MSFSNLDLVRQCDTFSTSEGAYEFRYREFLLGYVCKKVAGALHEFPKGWWKVEKNHIRFADEADTSMERRCEVIRMTVDTWRIRKRFKVLEKWRDELYSVYAPSHTVLFTIERAASPLFGVATFGVHMIAFTTNPLMLWVSKRAQTRRTAVNTTTRLLEALLMDIMCSTLSSKRARKKLGSTKVLFAVRHVLLVLFPTIISVGSKPVERRGYINLNTNMSTILNWTNQSYQSQMTTKLTISSCGPLIRSKRI